MTTQPAGTSAHNKYFTDDTSTMEKLLQVADQHAVTSTPVESHIDREKFLGYMQKNLVRSFFSMLHAEYLSKSKDKRVSLISRYYIKLSNGEDWLFFCLTFGSVFWVELRLPYTIFFYLLQQTLPWKFLRKQTCFI